MSFVVAADQVNVALTRGIGALCADYEAWLVPRGVDDQPFGRLTGWSALTWQRVRNGVSQATVRFDNVTAIEPSCCRVLQSLRPWSVELQVQRRGTGDVWVGPIVSAPVSNGTMTLTAYDLGKWLDKRRIHSAFNVKGEEARDVFAALWHDAIDRENGMRFRLALDKRTGVLVDFTSSDAFGSAQIASGALSQMVSSAVDYVTVGRTMTAGAPKDRKVIAQLTDSMIVGIPDYDFTGENQANDLVIQGQARGGGGANTPAAHARADGSFRHRDGLLERIDTDQSLQTLGECSAAAADRIAIYADTPAVVGAVRLAPRAPYSVADDLIPGQLIDVRLANLCRQIAGVYRIQEVNCSVDASTEGGGEQVNLTLQYEAALTLPVIAPSPIGIPGVPGTGGGSPPPATGVRQLTAAFWGHAMEFELPPGPNSDNLADIAAAEAALGRSFTGARRNSPWLDWPPDAAWTTGRRAIYANGTPTRHPGSDASGTFWPNVAAGAYDVELTAMILSWKTDGRWTQEWPVFLSFHHEQCWSSELGGTKGGAPGDYQAAQARFHDLVFALGAHYSQPGGCIAICFVPDIQQLMQDPLWGNHIYSTTNEPYTYRITQCHADPANYDVFGADVYLHPNGQLPDGTPIDGGEQIRLVQAYARSVGKPWLCGEIGAARDGVNDVVGWIGAVDAAITAGGVGWGSGKCIGLFWTDRATASDDLRMSGGAGTWNGVTRTAIDPAVTAAYAAMGAQERYRAFWLANDLTPPAPTPPTDFVTDLFERTTSGGLGTASDGQGYQTVRGNTSSLATDGHDAVIGPLGSGAQTVVTHIDALARSDIGLLAKVRIDTAAVGANETFTVRSRYADFANNVRVTITNSIADGTANLAILETVGGVDKVILAGSSCHLDGFLDPAFYYWVRYEAIGPIWRVKIWQDGTAEPPVWRKMGNWTWSLNPGGYGFGAINNTGSTVTPSFHFAEFHAYLPVGGTSPPPPPPPPPITVLASDTFERTVAVGGIGTADDGFGYTTRKGGFSKVSVDGHDLVIGPTTSGDDIQFTHNDPSTYDDIGYLVKFKVAPVPAGANQQFQLRTRWTDLNNNVRIVLSDNLTAGHATLAIIETVGNVDSTIISTFDLGLGGLFDPTAYYWVRHESFGQTWRIRVWKDGTAEPSTWLTTGTHTWVLTAGGYGLAILTATGSTAAPTYRVAQWSVYVPGT